MVNPVQLGVGGDTSGYCLVTTPSQFQSQLPLGAGLRCHTVEVVSPIAETEGLHTCVVPLHASKPPFAQAPIPVPTLQAPVGTSSTTPSQSSSVPGLAQVSGPLA